MIEIPVEKIRVGVHEQRQENDDPELDELSASIRRVGVIVPLAVRKDGDRFVVIAGHRRLAAAKKAGLNAVPCSIRDDSDSVTTEVCFAENMFRKDLSPFELACAIEDCIKNKIMTMDELAAGLHRSPDWCRRMRTLLQWPGDVLQAIHGGWLSISAATNIAMIEDGAYRGFLLKNAKESGATARTTAAWLQAWRSMAPVEQAVQAEPIPPESRSMPMVPQAPCLCCSQVFRTDELSHVPVCAQCIRIIREIGSSR